MKSFILRKDEYENKSRTDLLIADVIFDSGEAGVAHVTRSRAEMLVFEFSHIGKIMTQEDFEKYRDLVQAEFETERLFDDEYD